MRDALREAPAPGHLIFHVKRVVIAGKLRKGIDSPVVDFDLESFPPTDREFVD